MKNRLLSILSLSLMVGSANAQDMRVSRQCEDFISSFMGYSESMTQLDEEFMEEARRKVIYSVSNSTAGFDLTKRCIKELGLNILEDVNKSDVKTLGMSVKIGNQCLSEITDYVYPLTQGEYNIERFEFDGSEKMCVGILYQRK